ncbi:class I SAM-dependent methyltransferase [Bradyrhizobium algeriense]|uniref:class I SAM-dependent methyltransferase n=1 Tax=Bradyrhizobium algeriense TaxID=634784 RepID=UPI0011AEA4B2|nr:class I SAM-dependent methyltransferase [Bradyrhizobium algeriense]
MSLEGSARQREHYDVIHDSYEAHYYDAESMEYRRRFLFAAAFDGLNLNGKRVADVASGSGHNSLLLLERFPQAEMTGFDISPRARAAYEQIVRRPAFELDLTKPTSTGETFDAAIVVGGLHHCVVDLQQTFANLGEMIRPGGTLFILLEPNRDFILQFVRKFWYRNDPLFDADTEEALRHDAIAATAHQWFEPEKVTYFGGPAFFLVLNSLVLRISPGIKKRIARPLMAMEQLYMKLPGRLPFPVFMARWIRRDIPS